MKKGFDRDITTQIVVNGYAINAFSFQQHDPNNPNTARVDVTYSLASIGQDGTVTLSDLPAHRGASLSIYNVGDNRHLGDWLAGNGTPGDPLRFDYHDVERLIEVDIQTRFGVQLNKK